MAKRLNGFTLLEVVISLFVVAMMLLGMDALQLTSLRATKALYYSRLAAQQLNNLSQYLFVLKGADLSEQFASWNRENHNILPNGIGIINGEYPEYKLKIFWGSATAQNCETNKIADGGCLQMFVNVLN